MWRNKKNYPAKVGAAALLTACLLAKTVPVSADDTAYQTAVVTRGTMTVEVNMQAEYVYVKEVPLIFSLPCGSATFLEYVVDVGSYVMEGDVIANIAVDVDEIALEEIKLRLQRAEASRDKAYAEMSKRHTAAQKAVEESSGTQRQIAQLRLEQLEMEQERSKRQIDTEVAQLQEEVDAYEEVVGMTQIFAPASGRLINRLNYSVGRTPIWDGMKIAVIECDVEPMFSLRDPGNVMRYGMPVVLTGGYEEGAYECKVVSCGSKYLTGNFTEEKAYFKPTEAGAWGRDAVYENIHIDNVLLVDTAAVQNDKNGSYVVELKDGKLSKCYFTVGKTVNNLCYALDGLTEGMTVIVR